LLVLQLASKFLFCSVFVRLPCLSFALNNTPRGFVSSQCMQSSARRTAKAHMHVKHEDPCTAGSLLSTTYLRKRGRRARACMSREAPVFEHDPLSTSLRRSLRPPLALLSLRRPPGSSRFLGTNFLMGQDVLLRSRKNRAPAVTVLDHQRPRAPRSS
jgi:hypothetical protein